MPHDGVSRFISPLIPAAQQRQYLLTPTFEILRTKTVLLVFHTFDAFDRRGSTWNVPLVALAFNFVEQAVDDLAHAPERLETARMMTSPVTRSTI